MESISNSRDPIAAYQRKTKAVRRVGVNTRCECGEARPEALIPQSTPMICAACQRKSRGKNTMDKHHVAGKANSSVTVSIPVNDHRARLSVEQYEWPPDTLRNPNRCPLLRIAACIRGFINTVHYLIDALLVGVVEILEGLSRRLWNRLGPNWWREISLINAQQEEN